jgi:hypothetical protein
LPPYTAVTDVEPFGSEEVIKVAEPPLSVPVPNTVVPLSNETVSPSGGAPALERTVAVKVTSWPEVDGFGDDASVVVVFVVRIVA